MASNFSFQLVLSATSFATAPFSFSFSFSILQQRYKFCRLKIYLAPKKKKKKEKERTNDQTKQTLSNDKKAIELPPPAKRKKQTECGISTKNKTGKHPRNSYGKTKIKAKKYNIITSQNVLNYIKNQKKNPSFIINRKPFFFFFFFPFCC